MAPAKPSSASPTTVLLTYCVAFPQAPSSLKVITHGVFSVWSSLLLILLFELSLSNHKNESHPEELSSITLPHVLAPPHT